MEDEVPVDAVVGIDELDPVGVLRIAVPLPSVVAFAHDPRSVGVAALVPEVGLEDLIAEELGGAVVRVRTDEPVPIAALGVTEGPDHPDRRLLADVELEPGDAEGPGVDIVRGAHVTLSLLVDAEQPDVEGPNATRELATAPDRNRVSVLAEPDATREEGLSVHPDVAEVEDALVLEEELALLREEERELREVHPHVVDWGLPEVGIRGSRGSERGHYPVAGVEARCDPGVVALLVLVFSPPLVVDASDRRRGQDIDPEPVTRPREADQDAGVRHVDEASVLPRVGPAAVLLGTPNAAQDVQAPGVRALPEAHGLEGDHELRRPAVLVDARLDVPDAVPLEQEPRILDQAVHPCSEGIRLEEVAVATVLEGVDHDPDLVFGRDAAVSQHVARDDPACIVVPAADTDVEVVAIREDPDLRDLAHRRTLDGLHLGERTDGGRLFPDRIVENTVDRGARLDVRGAGCGLATRLSPNGGYEPDQQQDDGEELQSGPGQGSATVAAKRRI